jgi:hypothetical protein
MASETKLPVTQKPGRPDVMGEIWRPFGALRMEVDRLSGPACGPEFRRTVSEPSNRRLSC